MRRAGFQSTQMTWRVSIIVLCQLANLSGLLGKSQCLYGFAGLRVDGVRRYAACKGVVTVEDMAGELVGEPERRLRPLACN